MSRYTFQIVICLIFVAVCHLRAENRALLIGVSEYPNLPKDKWLKGPENDIKLVESLLTSKRLGFDKKNITTLTGWPKEVDKRPTAENIRKNIMQLVEKTQKGDFIFLLFSGHGSQQPSDQSITDIEPDGLDEIFLPADIGKWDDTKKTVKNAIVDDEVKRWITFFLRKEALVWVIFDSCHSGTMTRNISPNGRVFRHISPSELIPESVMSDAKGAVTFRGKGTDDGLDVPSQAKGLVAMYAAQSIEPTFEMPLPNPTDKRHGIFTYMMAKVLLSAEGDFTYRELVDRVTTIYRCNGIFQPMPLIEGSAVDTVVGKSGQSQELRKITLMVTGTGELLIDRGALHGIRKGFVLEVFPPAGTKESDTSQGFVKVTKVNSLYATVEPAAHGKAKAPKMEKLSPFSRCNVVEETFGCDPFKMAVSKQAKEQKQLQAILEKVCTQNPNLVSSATADEADWLLSMEKEKLLLTPATGWSTPESSRNGAKPRFEVGALKGIVPPETTLLTAVKQISKARQLLNIASTQGASDKTPGSVNAIVQIVKYPDLTSSKGEIVNFSKKGRELHDGDIITFRLTNPNPFAIDVTLLFIDSQYGISPLFPDPETVDDNRLFPGKSVEIPRFTVTADTVGPEQVVVLAVRSTLDRQDFSCLAQKSLGVMRGNSAVNSPLGQLLQSTMFDQGSTRGLSRKTVKDFGALVIPWVTVP